VRRRFTLPIALVAVIACSNSSGPSGDDAESRDAGASAEADGGTADGEAPAVPVPGLLAEYFDGYSERALVRVEPGVDHLWDDGGPGGTIGKDHFSVRWSGTLTVPKTGKYKIAIESDDGVRLYFDEKLIIDDWTGHFVKRDEKEVELTAGTPIALRLDYFEYDLKAQARLLWSTDGMPEAPISDQYLLTTAPSGKAGPMPPYQNPILAFDCPDPGVLAEASDNGRRYYVTCTGGPFPIRTSKSLLFWEDSGSFILPNGKPAWAANGGRNWAPEIHRVGNAYVAYYTTVNASDSLCIGASTASSPLGPFKEGTKPLVEHPHGVIDATFFEDEGGARWLFFKNDGNGQTPQQPTLIYAQQLALDGLSFAAGSTPKEVLRNDVGTWEGHVIEAPWVVKRGQYYYLFYSGNVFDSNYRTGVARATKLTGPYTKFGPPILANNAVWEGPGHGSVVHVGDLDYFVYHAYPKGVGKRFTLLDRIDWKDGWPKIHDGTPSRSLQPGPGELR
jgi:GH43 family beta-xylosidase